MIRQPIQNLYTKNVTSTLAGSDTFALKYSDFDALLVKLVVTSIGSGSTNQLNVYVQSSDDGGTTFYDNVALATVSAAIANQNALFYTVCVNAGDAESINNITASATGGYVGTSTGLPLLSNLVRVVWNYGTMVSSASTSWTITLSTQNQSAHV